MKTTISCPASRPLRFKRFFGVVSSPLWLLALQLAALWPHWLWMARRAGDGSDEPWGMVALAAVAILVWADRRQLARKIPGAALAVAGGFSVAAALGLAFLPPIVAAGLAMLAVAVLLAGMLPPERPRAALAFLALLALPLAASLNFYLGYPLRWLCARGAAAILGMIGWQATPEGAALLWNGQIILVDAPCAGVAMLWVGLFAATLLSYLHRASAWRTACNLGAAVVLVVAANVLRNALLFFKEAGIVNLPGWTHDALGLLAFGLALWPLYLIVAWRPAGAPGPGVGRPSGRLVGLKADLPGLHRQPAFLLFLVALLCAAALPLLAMPAPLPCPLPGGTENRCAMLRTKAASPEWAEARWLPADAAPLRRPLTTLEESFASRFPGHIARFSEGRRAWIVRVMDRPTRMLHPAVDCFRGLGYDVEPPRVRLDARERSWRCFAAEKNGRRLKVCERIFDAGDGNWTDTSAWYWSALLGVQRGPWWAVTQVEEVGTRG